MIWLMHLACTRYDQRYGDSSNISCSPECDIFDVHCSDTFEKDFMPNELRSSAGSGSYTAQTWQVVADGPSGLGQVASYPQQRMSSTNRPALLHDMNFGPISSGGATMQTSMALDSYPSVISPNAHHVSPAQQQQIGAAMHPRLGFTTPHTTPIALEHTRATFGVPQNQLYSGMQCAIPSAPSVVNSAPNGLHQSAPGFSHEVSQLDFPGSAQHSNYHIRNEKK